MRKLKDELRMKDEENASLKEKLEEAADVVHQIKVLKNQLESRDETIEELRTDTIG